MRRLVGLRVSITRDSTGNAKYPNFNSLPVVQSSGMDWSRFVDVNGSGWLYDCCGHDEEDTDSPVGHQFGLLLVPRAFANQAESSFPATCTRISRAETERFYNERHARDMPDEEIDLEILQGIKIKEDLLIPLTQQQIDAKDPTKNERGVRTNWRKNFASYKSRKQIDNEEP